MLKNTDIETARDFMLERIVPVGTEKIELTRAYGRVLAEELLAQNDSPPFDRSPYDGYAFRAADSLGASADKPLTLRVIEEIPAGHFPEKAIGSGCAAKILTGGPIPEGADVVVKYEETDFTEETVSLKEQYKPGNIVRAGEDVKKGAVLSRAGVRIDPALYGTLASQGIASPLVYKRPRAGIISTGSELVDVDSPISGGLIRNSNRYVLEAACIDAGIEPVILGTPGDRTEDIAELFKKGLEDCDFVLSTGGVSVGDYDLTPAAMEQAGIEILVRKLKFKPGGPCAYGMLGNKPVFALSGNPTACITNFYAVVLPCAKKLAGYTDCLNKRARVKLAEGFDKGSPNTRLLRGRLDISSGEALMELPGQGNAMLHDMSGCDVFAVVPRDSGALEAGTELEAWLV